MMAPDGFLARLVRALAARPSVTTASTPLPTRTRIAAALAARPIAPATGFAAPVGVEPITTRAGRTGWVTDERRVKLASRVRAVVAGLLGTTADQLRVDSDGDIGIRAGSAMIFVRAQEEPSLVDVFCPLLTGVQPSELLYRRLSDLTNRMPLGRVWCTGDTVWASVPVLGQDFQPSHLRLAIEGMVRLADDLDDLLRAEFGGNRFFDSGPATLTPVPDPTNYLRGLADAGTRPARTVLVDLLAERGRFDELRARAKSGDWHAASRLAGLLHGRGQDAEAERWWRLAADGGEPAARTELATLLAAQGRTDDAVPVLAAAIEHDDWSAAGPLLRLLTRQGRVDEAVAVLRARKPRTA